MQEKQIKINNLNINYKEIGNGDVLFVLLHGWGIDSDQYVELADLIANSVKIEKKDLDDCKKFRKSFNRKNEYDNDENDNLQKNFTKKNEISNNKIEKSQDIKFMVKSYQSSLGVKNDTYRIIIPDLPGFGKSDEPSKSWNLDDYVEFTDKFIKSILQVKGFELIKNIFSKANIENIINGGFSSISTSKTEEKKKVILIGHSFGGRIAIKYAVKYSEKIEKLILTGAAGIKRRLTWKQKVFFIAVKMGKTFFSLPIISKFQEYAREFLYKIAREKDYYRASPRMKEIMKNILAEDLTPILKKIKTPTLLIWGKLDNSTPLSDGKIMNEKIENSELVIFGDANHSLPYQKPKEFAEKIIDFIKKV